MTTDIHCGDCRSIIPILALGLTVDAVVTDPPYHLLPTVNRFAKSKIGGTTDIERRALSRADGLGRLSSGFMGSKWDGGDIAFRPETWATIGSVLRPGGYLVAFGGTRTWHRLACAIEDAGFVIQDTLMWLFATGFPKRRDMLKPAYEPIVLAYKPGGKRSLQIDECRISTSTEDIGDPARFRGIGGNRTNGWDRPQHHQTDEMAQRAEAAQLRAATLGRWPANIVTDGSDEVVATFPESAGSPASEFHRKESLGSLGYQSTVQIASRSEFAGTGYGDGGGSAARFYFTAKADESDRWGSRHPTVKPVSLMRWLVALVTPPGGRVLDPFAGTGTTGAAALIEGRNAVLIEREEQHVKDILERIEWLEKDDRYKLFRNQDKSQIKVDLKSARNAPAKGWWRP